MNENAEPVGRAPGSPVNRSSETERGAETCCAARKPLLPDGPMGSARTAGTPSPRRDTACPSRSASVATAALRSSTVCERPAMTTTANDASIRERLDFIQMDSEGRAALRSLKALVDRELPLGLDKLYAQIRRTPETARLFASEAQMTGAKGAQLRHWVNIANGDFNADYARNVQAIGKAHAAIGLEPRWYIGGYAVVLDHVVRAAVEEMFPKGGLFARKTVDAGECGKALGSLVKAVLLDMDLAISVYMEEAETAKQAVAAIAGERQFVADSFGAAMAAMAGKDLTCRVSGDLPEAYHALRDDFNAAVGTLGGALHEVGEVSFSIDAVAREIAGAAEDLSRRTEQQAAAVSSTEAACCSVRNAT
ncbi:MAG: hypothetical protein F9K43_18995, partial [Bauldia sp.]